MKNKGVTYLIWDKIYPIVESYNFLSPPEIDVPREKIDMHCFYWYDDTLKEGWKRIDGFRRLYGICPVGWTRESGAERILVAEKDEELIITGYHKWIDKSNPIYFLDFEPSFNTSKVIKKLVEEGFTGEIKIFDCSREGMLRAHENNITILQSKCASKLEDWEKEYPKKAEDIIALNEFLEGYEGKLEQIQDTLDKVEDAMNKQLEELKEIVHG